MADDKDTPDAEAPPAAPFPAPSLEDIQHWTFVMGRAQQLMMEHLALQMGEATEKAAEAAEPEHAERIAAVDDRVLAGHEHVRRSGEADGAAGAAVDRGARHLAAGAREIHGRPEAERRALAAGRESGQGQALRRARMARQSDLRHDPPDLFADLRPAARHGRRDRGRRRRDARADALRHPGLRRCDEPVQFRADQPAGDRSGRSRPRARTCSRAWRTCCTTSTRASSPRPSRARSRSAATSRRRRAR